MSTFYNVRNGGKSSVPYGFQKANSRNLKPTTVVALATTGQAITTADLDAFDMFNVAQTSAATDLIILPTDAAQGTQIVFYSISAVKIKAATGSGIGTNGGTDAQGITTVAGDTHVFFKANATNWIVSKTVAAGTVSVPTAA